MPLFKRGLVWWISINENGIRIRKSTGVAEKKLAGKIHAKILTQIAEGTWLDKPIGEDKTFGEMMERYDKEHFSYLPSSKTCRSYFNGLVEFFGEFTLSEISPKLIHEFKVNRKVDKKTPATINRQLTIAKAAFNIAVREWEWCKENPFTKVSSEKGANKRTRWLTLDEENRLLAVCAKWLRDFIIFAAWTGIREGNIINLEKRQIDLSKKLIHIGGNTNHRTKNNNPLAVPMNERIFMLLKGKINKQVNVNSFVFTSPLGKKISPNNLRRSFRKSIIKAGIKDLTLHDLRHTYGTRLAQAGVDIYTIAKLLGHKDIRATQRYVHHCTKSLRLGINILEQDLDTIGSQSPQETFIS